ncbi:hypothetical protein JQ615_19530 [Bradyrhizobium jicamae]|uniref:Uncharacterized protein n=1 Tax=Bradyrhizobium jicamae TaxID=280332 RepID=A0ABS5FLB9_9BRAD|nr:hypothetical protein [Bradyrhizobium jicamae]MBR0797583.1 hypothetical protein [Bradyrhizobium jicamae]
MIGPSGLLGTNARAVAPLLVVLCLSGCAATTEYVSTPEAAASPTPEAGSLPPAAPTATSTRELSVTERATLADAFAASLSNPEGVKFKWTRIPVVTGEGRRSFDYCAQLNAQNDKGAYQGLQPFLATIIVENGVVTGGAIATTGTRSAGRDSALVPALCRQKGLDPFA